MNKDEIRAAIHSWLENGEEITVSLSKSEIGRLYLLLMKHETFSCIVINALSEILKDDKVKAGEFLFGNGMKHLGEIEDPREDLSYQISILNQKESHDV